MLPQYPTVPPTKAEPTKPEPPIKLRPVNADKRGRARKLKNDKRYVKYY
jgi:hypothetical protein